MDAYYTAVGEKSSLVIELTRRNLKALLAKLDGFPAGSARSLGKGGITVKAVEDAEHYSDRAPGLAHPETEARMEEE